MKVTRLPPEQALGLVIGAVFLSIGFAGLLELLPFTNISIPRFMTVSLLLGGGLWLTLYGLRLIQRDD